MGQPRVEPSAERQRVQSVVRAMDLLTSFSAVHPRFRLGELAAAVGLPKSSTRRIAWTLVGAGFLRQDPDGFYSLGGRLLELGGMVSNSSTLAGLTATAMRLAHEHTGETILVAEVNWVDQSTLITHKIDGVHALAVTSPVGKRTTLGGGCIGKAALAALPEEEANAVISRTALVKRTNRSVTDPAEFFRHVERARDRGYSTEIGEFLEGCSAVAVPIMVDGRPLGAIGIVAPTSRAGVRQLDAWGRLLLSLTAK